MGGRGGVGFWGSGGGGGQGVVGSGVVGVTGVGAGGWGSGGWGWWGSGVFRWGFKVPFDRPAKTLAASFTLLTVFFEFSQYFPNFMCRKASLEVADL